MKVLLIEQSRLPRVFLTRLFDGLSFEVEIANDMDTALAQVRDGDLDLICLNRYLEGMDAFEFAKKARMLGCESPMLLLTADRSQPTAKKARDAGIAKVIPKDSMPAMAENIRTFVQENVKADLHYGKVLYVEDSKTQSTIVSNLLKTMGLDVDHTVTAEDAIERFDANDDYDIVITDLLLKGKLSGLDLVSHVRGREDDKSRIPVLTLTSYDDAARRIELLKAGTNDYIVKPVLREELSVRVSNLISNKQLMDEVVRQQIALQEMAITDQLTGCHNRHGFVDLTEKYLPTAKRRREQVSLLMLDLDHFKNINDNYGHDMGDKVLREVGAELKKSCREGDIVSRMGGEEFVLFLADCDKTAAMNMAQRVRRNILGLKPGGLTVTTSVGVTTIGKDHKVSLEQALSAADKGVYRAKNRGRNCVSYHACESKGDKSSSGSD